MGKQDPPARRVRRGAIAAIWSQYASSYDASILDNYVHPRTVFPVLLGASGIILAMYFIPQARAYTALDHPWIAISILLAACTTSLLQWRFWKHPQYVNVLQLLDNCFYCLAVIAVMADTSTPVHYVWALIYAQMAASYGQRYSFNWPMLFSVCVIPFGVTLFFCITQWGVLALVLFGIIMFIVNSTTTTKAREVQKQKDRFESAYLITDKVATKSLDIALATSLAEVGNFLHSLRNAITPAIGHLMILRSDKKLSDDSKEAVESLERSIGRSNDLIENLLNTIKGRAAPTETVFVLNDVLEVDALAGGLAPADRHKLHLKGDVPEFEINGNPEHLKAAVENLVLNALQAGAGNVDVEASYDGGLKRAIITVRDDGPGIPEDFRDNLFQPDAVNRKGVGHGLGLPLSKRLVEVLEGELRLSNTGKGGTTFEIGIAGRHIPTTIPPQRPVDDAG